ncbi:AI-2E family transporter [Nanoarchaeota archaeon]
MDNGEYYSKIFFIIVFAVLTFAALWIIKPFIIILLGAGLLAYVSNPVYSRLLKKTKSKGLSATIILLIIILLLAVPFVSLTQTVSKEGVQLYLLTKQKIATGKIIDIECSEEDTSLGCSINKNVQEFVSDTRNKFYLENVLSKGANFIVDKSSDFLLMLPQIILFLFVMLFTVFYLLTDSKNFIEQVKSWIPLKESHKEMIFKQFANLTHATVYGQFVVALIQGGLGALVYLALGISSPIIWGLLTAFFALLPVLGTAIIWVPLAINLLINGFIIKGIILLLLGTFVISLIDNILKPRIIGKRTKLHPVLVLVGVVGGLITMGLIGIVLGPLIFSLLISFVEVYHKEKRR